MRRSLEGLTIGQGKGRRGRGTFRVDDFFLPFLCGFVAELGEEGGEIFAEDGGLGIET